jgi:hypothetical protein
MLRLSPSALATTLMLVMAGLVLPSGPAKAKPYGNGRFSYWIDYPENLLVPGREADNGDGLRFHARKGSAEMSVWGEYNALDQSPREMVREYERGCGPRTVTFEVANARLAAFSCTTPKGRIIYQKTMIRKDVLATVRLEYPVSEQALWDPVVRQVASSLKAGIASK